jgi:glycosyltransferase involved in cell wall biosynthesis
LVRTAFISTYPPRRCGIATFTADLGLVAGEHEVVALSPPDHALGYPGKVHHVIRRDVLSDYARVARRLAQCVDVVSIQHEYGIWGGRDGASVVDFARSLGVPAVATLHTILRKPTAHQRAILVELVDSVSATVVMSRSAAALLTAAYGVDPLRVEIIPHGVADLPLVRSESVKPSVGLAGRRVILSFGLLGPGKGYELALDALPAVAAAYPDVCYVIVGATHPDMVRREGEAYRQSLVERVERLGLWDHVRFVDRFVGRAELERWLESADVFVTPYPNLEQIVSGTLSSAMGAGRAIVSTPYTYASELLANGKGVLVAPGSSEALGAVLVSLLGDDRRRADLGRRAYAHSRGMVWAESGGRYRRLFARVAAATATPEAAAGLRPAVHA